MLYVVWYDETPKQPVSAKIEAAIAAYSRRFSDTPDLVLVNQADYIELPGMQVRVEMTVQPNTFWVGRTGSA